MLVTLPAGARVVVDVRCEFCSPDHGIMTRSCRYSLENGWLRRSSALIRTRSLKPLLPISRNPSRHATVVREDESSRNTRIVSLLISESLEQRPSLRPRCRSWRSLVNFRAAKIDMRSFRMNSWSMFLSRMLFRYCRPSTGQLHDTRLYTMVLL